MARAKSRPAPGADHQRHQRDGEHHRDIAALRTQKVARHGEEQTQLGFHGSALTIFGALPNLLLSLFSAKKREDAVDIRKAGNAILNKKPRTINASGQAIGIPYPALRL
jgi:hypothetical protein